MQTSTLNGRGQFLPSGGVDRVVRASAARLHPLVVDKVTKAPSMVVQPGIDNGRGLGGGAILQCLENITH